ncbi:MAG: hypothetical protein GWN58_57075, partial [Anaerolineae bacterium]|nr:hypothetical protein [Anaerolineae bacterium]
RNKLPKGSEVFDQVGKNLINWLPGYTVSALARMHAQIANWRRLWEVREVRLVVVHEDVAENTRSLVQFAKARGTPTLHVPHFNHGTIPGEPPDLHDALNCDYVAVAGEYMAEWYERRGVDSSRIRITGHPQWDRFAAMRPDRYFGHGSLRTNPALKTVLYCADWVLWTTLCYDEQTPVLGWQTMLEAFRMLQREGWQLICKAHPGAKDTTAQWHAQMAKNADVGCTVSARHLDIMLQAADVVVSNGFSNVITEAALVGVPGLTLGPGYLDQEAVPSVDYDAEALYRTVKGAHEQRRVWSENLRGPFIERYAGPNDGLATQRILDWCRELAGG